jgi:hypothetical protein
VSTVVVVVGLVCGGMAAYVAAMARAITRRATCPACGKKTLRMRSLVRGHVWPPRGRPIDESLHRCDACGSEFGRENDGPLVPKQAWDEGARGEIPKATALPPKER